MRRSVPGILLSVVKALVAGASLAASAVAFISWQVDDGTSRPRTYRLWNGSDGSTYFVLLGAGRLTAVRQGVTRPPGGEWTADVSDPGTLQIRAGGKDVASVTSVPRWRGWPPGWGRFHQPGPKVMFVAPPLKGPQVCAINYSGASLPLWTVAAVTALPPVAWLLGFLRKGRSREARLRGGLCVECGYDLRGSPGRCPECGSIRNPASMVTTS